MLPRIRQGNSVALVELPAIALQIRAANFLTQRVAIVGALRRRQQALESEPLAHIFKFRIDILLAHSSRSEPQFTLSVAEFRVE